MRDTLLLCLVDNLKDIGFNSRVIISINYVSCGSIQIIINYYNKNVLCICIDTKWD